VAWLVVFSSYALLFRGKDGNGLDVHKFIWRNVFVVAWISY
jgi:hypothetical protein